MKWKSIWRHTTYIFETLTIYFLLIQGPYDLWISKTDYALVTYLIDIIGITGLFFVVELIYNLIRQAYLKRYSK